MVIKNVRFSNVTNCRVQTCRKKDDNTIEFSEYAQVDTKKKYTGYSSDTTVREQARPEERSACDTFMKSYARYVVGPESRDCVTTCSEVRQLSDEEMEENTEPGVYEIKSRQ